MNGNQQNQTKQDDKKKQAPQPAQEEDEFEEFNDHGKFFSSWKSPTFLHSGTFFNPDCMLLDFRFALLSIMQN